MDHVRGSAPPEAAAWFREEQADALADLARAMSHSWEAVQAGYLAWAEAEPKLAGWLATDGREGLLASGPSLTVLGRALGSDVRPLSAELRRVAEICHQTGLGLEIASGWAGQFRRVLLPKLVEAHWSEPTRLTRVLQVMNDFAERAAGTTASAYLALKRRESRAREEDLATTLDSIGDAVVVTDATGNIVRMNPVAERLMGVPMRECHGKPLAEYFRIENEDTGEPVESPVDRVLREGVVVGLANHTVLVARDGMRRPIADSGAPVRHESGEVRGVVLVFRDVTLERRAEEQLRHWERIFQHATWGVALASIADVRFEAVNPAYASMHGYTVEELLGAPVSTLWAPDTHSDMERHAASTHEHGRLVAETTHLCKDGSLLPVEVVATTIKDAHGVPRWFVANVQDVRERRRLQQSRVRAIELEAENRRIEEANRLKSEFLANMSHELRTPLNSIIGFAELLHDEQVGSIEPKQKEFLGEILGGGRHLLRLINEVLDLAKIEAGKMDFRPEWVDLGVLVGNVVQGLRPAARDKKLSIAVSVDPTLRDIVIDPGRFKQVLYNYLSNALKFTTEGGQIAVRVLPESADTFRLEVEDNGPGIADENATRLFMAFQQLDASATKRHAGTGLGLALTKRLVEAQGGTVGVRRAEPNGSVFMAVLPRGPKTVARQTERRSDIPTAVSILVVESNPDDRRMLLETLERSGYKATGAATCREAVEAWSRNRYDALTLDFLDQQGSELRELLDLVRRGPRGKDTPVIAMTMSGERGVAAGFPVTDVLRKPVDAGELLAALQRGGAPPMRGRPVLVVDDDAASLKLMEATLGQLGYDALCFGDARDALRALDRVRPLAVILDLIMPDMDGLSFLERFRSNPENRRVPVMVWTVKDLSLEERRGLQAAVHAVVQKGVEDSFRLSATLQAFFGRPGLESPAR